jgi:hypothetical protein
MGLLATMPITLPFMRARLVMTPRPKVGWISNIEPRSATSLSILRMSYAARRSRGTISSKASSQRSTGSSHGMTGGSSQTFCGMKLKKRLIIAKHSSSLRATLSIVPAVSTATAEPPSASLVGESPNARATSGGPAANIWLVFLTITDQCARTALAAGPPAAVPITAHTTGTHDSRSTERSKPLMPEPGNAVYPRCRIESTLPPAPSIRLMSGMRYS